MELRQLEYFRAVARQGSISRAAEELFVSQPSISKSIQNLEKELGTPLFDRIGKQVMLNRAGETALEYTTHVFNILDAMKGALSHYSPAGQPLNICTNIPLFLRYLTPLFTVEHPEITVNALFVGQSRLNGSLLAERAYDILLSGTPVEEPGIIDIPILTDHPVLCIPSDSPLALEQQISLKQLQGLAILVPETIRDGFHFRFIREYLKKKGITPNYVTPPDVGAARYLFSKTSACAIQSELTMRFHKYTNGIYLPIDDPGFVFHYYLSLPEAHPAQADVFVSWFQNLLEHLPLSDA